MAVAIKLEPIDKEIEAIYATHMSPQARSKLLGDFALEELGKARAKNAAALGRAPDYTQVVDGKVDAPVHSVKPTGYISFEFELLDPLFTWIGEMLVKHSPIGKGTDRRPGHPGLYMSSHVFMADGLIVNPGDEPPPADEYVYMNTQPYARKIERGLSDQTPEGVYQVVAQLARRRFGNLMHIEFNYRSPLFGAVDQWASSTRMESPGRRGASRAEWLRRQPAIVISHYALRR